MENSEQQNRDKNAKILNFLENITNGPIFDSHGVITSLQNCS